MAIIIKNKKQIDGIRKSCQLAANALNFIEPHVKAGVTTEELNQKLEEYIRSHGAVPAPLNYHGFPKAICTSINEVVCHGIPDQTVLKEGDIINIDVTFCYFLFVNVIERHVFVAKQGNPVIKVRPVFFDRDRKSVV